MGTATLDLFVASPKANIAHYIKCVEMTPIIDSNRFAAKVCKLSTKSGRDVIESRNISLAGLRVDPWSQARLLALCSGRSAGD